MRRRNFTLIELVVALGILSMVMLTAGIALSAVQGSYRTATEHERVLKQYRAIDRIAETAFRNAVPFYWRDRDNKEVMLFSGEPDSVTLAYRHRISDRQEGGLRFLRLFRQDGQLIAEYRARPFLNEERQALPFEREVIAEGVAGLHFLYADLRDGQLEWYETWDMERLKNLPMAIQMEVAFSGGGKQVWLRRTAGNGEFQQWGRRLNP